jgi:hypothetical protein
MKKKNMSENIIKVDRELFIETIEALKSQYEHDKKCSDALQIILPNDFVSGYDNHWVNNQLIKIIQIAMNDNHEYSWIEYYMFELDFGKEYHKGCATNKDGSEINLSTAGALWDFLCIEMNNL